ncbi:Holliday junction resolvase RuvX [Patescibacteria group bacterium]|nr:Holliday junction resolvase RuvX [Patescibacteria group bacterium]
MNALGIDFGTKMVGTAICIGGIITPLKSLPNDPRLFSEINAIISEYRIERIFIGLSEGRIAALTRDFIIDLKAHTHIPVETVNEAISTIEAGEYINPKKKHYKNKVDAISAAIILKRALL